MVCHVSSTEKLVETWYVMCPPLGNLWGFGTSCIIHLKTCGDMVCHVSSTEKMVGYVM